MSVLQPPYDDPYPIMTDAVRPVYEPVPVPEVEPVTPARPVRAEEERPPEATAEDVATLSAAARELTGDALDRSRSERTAANAAVSPAEPFGVRTGRALRELLATFSGYDNRLARTAYNYYLNMFTRYGSSEFAAEEDDAVNAFRTMENGAFRNLGVSRADVDTREVREGIARAVDRWFVGEGVFMPQMLGHSSSDGFLFSPLSQASMASLRSAEVLASYDRSRIALYLRELAGLGPNDFLFSDPTGLDEMTLVGRREFLARVDRLLADAELDLMAAELRYVRNADGSLAVDESRLAEERARREIRELTAQLNTYYGQLADSVSQYGPGVVSDAL